MTPTGRAPDRGREDLSCACGRTAESQDAAAAIGSPWSDAVIHTVSGDVPRVRTDLTIRDRIGSVKARWAIGRMSYRVAPGLYAAGNPDAGSPVLVSANYKMSFDRLRGVLAGRDAWILVLDTDGINVWCAAGKGTFGTDEIVRRVREATLDRIVSHRTLVVPQLGAPGVSAHEVRRRCGFRVVYGPVRAEDLPAFLDAGLKASPDMRKVAFGLRDRAVLIPVELVKGGKYALLIAIAFLLLGGLGRGGYSLAGIATIGFVGAVVVLGVFLSGVILGPVLLPWLPGRAFSVKGAALGLGLAGGLWLYAPFHRGELATPLQAAAWLILAPALASFVVMNFTGASTFTSLSGVRREMRFAVPLQAGAAVIGFGLWLSGLFLS